MFRYHTFCMKKKLGYCINALHVTHNTVYRSHRSHANVKIHTVAQIHTGVLSIPFIPYIPSMYIDSPNRGVCTLIVVYVPDQLEIANVEH